MVRWLPNRRHSPIGVDVGSRSVKLVQFTSDGASLLEAARGELPPGDLKALGSQDYARHVAEGIARAREGRRFRGNDAVLCLSDRELFLQNIRVPRSEGLELDRHVMQEAAGRIPFSVAEAEIRFLETADVRQGDQTLREVVVMACHRPQIERVLGVCSIAGLRPVALDVQPAALVRGYLQQFRRDDDKQQRALLLHVGYHSTVVVITKADGPLFVKYLDIGGKHFDEAVAKHLSMDLLDAAALRRNNGDRRSEMQDAEISHSITEGLRPVIERLTNELSMCIRYHSVTFRGQPLVRLLLGGGEASAALLDMLGKRLSLKCELSDPLRNATQQVALGRKGQWDVAVGLALRDVE
jgi:type IV pilus assembly protein PilM